VVEASSPVVPWLRTAAVVGATAVLTLTVFAPALRNGFVDWDDNVNLIQNLHYRGLGVAQLRWMFTASIVSGQWIPLTWLSLGLDFVLWGMRPVGYHLTNILLHAANAAVFFVLARRLLGVAAPTLGGRARDVGGVAAALFFALHPLRVESVAWVTERRDVLSGLFFLLAVLAYLRASEPGGEERRLWRVASLGFYVLALGAKAVVVMLPFVLVVLDVYPLRRISGRWRTWVTPGAQRIWLEKVPYVVLALGASAVGVQALRVTPTLAPDTYPFWARMLIGVHSLGFYVRMTVIPLGLSPLYELPARIDPLDPLWLASGLAVGGIAVFVWAIRRRWPAGLAACVAYAVLLLPVSGLIRTVGPQLVATRYSYLSCLPLALLVGAVVAWACEAGERGALRRPFVGVAVAGMAIWIIGLGGQTWGQVQVWRDTETLWRYALEIDPACARCHNNLGAWLADRGLLGEAIAHFRRAVALRPDHADVFRANLELALRRAGPRPQRPGAPAG